MPAIDLRSIILNNLEGSKAEEIRGYIQDTIDMREEDALPGMGILFEVVWRKSSETEKSNMLNKIVETLEDRDY